MEKQERTRRINNKETKRKAISYHRNNTKEKNKRKKVEEQNSHLFMYVRATMAAQLDNP